MKKGDAERMAQQINTTLVVLRARPEAQAGVRATAVMIAETVASDGRISPGTFLKLCGLHDPERVFVENLHLDEGCGED